MKEQGVGYVRISDDREGRELGVQRQRDDIERRAARDGVELVHVYQDNDISASTRSSKARPEYAQMLGDAERGAAGRYIYAYSNSRLTRRPREFEDLLDLHDRTGVQIRTVVSGDDDLATADGRMVARLKAVVDAAEAERLSERITRKLQQNAADGKHHGGMRPFGWNEDRTTLRETEAAVLRDAVTSVLGGESIRAICRRLTEQGVPTASWHPPLVLKPWRDVVLRDLLIKARIAGLREYKGEVVGPGLWAPIVEPEQWQAVKTYLLNPDRRQTPGRNGERHALSGVLRCGVCGSLMRVGRGRPYKGAPGKQVYRCSADTGTHVTRDKAKLEAFVSAVVIARLNRADAADVLQSPETDSAAGLLAEVENLRGRLEDAASAYAAGAITAAMMTQIAAKVRPQLEQAEAAYDAALKPLPPDLAELVKSADAAQVWSALPAVRQRAVIAVLMDVSVLPSRSGPHFDPAAVQITWK